MPMSADFDRAIDGAVRGMLAAEPRDDVRVRVLARIEGGRRTLLASARASIEPANPGIAFSLRRMILVLGTTAAAVLIAMIVWPARKPASIAPAVASVPFAYVVPSPIVPTVRPLGPSELQPMARSEPRRPATEAAIPNDGAVSIEVAILNPLAPIAVASVRTEQIAPARIELRPLAPLTDIGVALIQPPDRRH